MAVELVCSCGTKVRCDAPRPGERPCCPACGAALAIPAGLADVEEATEVLPTGARKPLWALMGKAPAPTADPAAAAATTNPPIGTPPVRKSLWSTMQSAGAAAIVPAATSTSSKSEIPDSQFEFPPDAALADVIGVSPAGPDFAPAERGAGIRAGRLRNALLSALLGGLSIVLSFLALIDAFWSKIPAALVGFASILRGMQAAGAARNAPGRE